MQKPQPPSLPPLMTVREVADYLRVSEPTIWRWIREGKLKGIKIGSTRRFSADEIASIIDMERDEGSSLPQEADTVAERGPRAHAISPGGERWPIQIKETFPVYDTDSMTERKLSPCELVTALRKRLREMRQERKARGKHLTYTSEDALLELRGERS
ncbi:MAG TPA: helix-turn-helix domain-containing protein [Firmicutes bacterium]|nr:helix-turn-helix domain-containing protein [Bacillota bacterium]